MLLLLFYSFSALVYFNHSVVALLEAPGVIHDSGTLPFPAAVLLLFSLPRDFKGVRVVSPSLQVHLKVEHLVGIGKGKIILFCCTLVHKSTGIACR